MKKSIYAIICSILALAYPSILELIFGYNEEFIYPTTLSHIPLIICIFVFFNLKNFFSKMFLLTWFAWLFIGEAFILSYYRTNPYYISQEEGCFIYALFIAFLSIGLFFNEYISFRKMGYSFAIFFNTQTKYDLHYLDYIFIIYPFVWIAIIYSNIGFIPILAGKDVTDNMYELNYGAVYGFGLYNCLSALILYIKFKSSTAKLMKYIWLSILILIIIIMSFDSKRLFLLLTMIIIFIYEKTVSKKLSIDRFTIVSFFVALIAYAGFQSIRVGNTSVARYESQGLPVGVEFREYIRTVNSFNPGEIKNFDLLTSTFVSLMNSSVLQLFGFSKAELAANDSANAWMKIFDAENSLGIRTGFVSELYFSYGYYGVFFIFIAGIFVSKISNLLLRTREVSSLAMLSIIYGLSILTVFGQLSVWAGLISLVGYLYVIVRVGKNFIGHK